MPVYKEDDLNLLIPEFRERVDTVLARMKALGYKPVVRDTLRTLDEAQKNVARKTGVLLSMHLYGCACDIICAEHGWDCAKHGCKFYEDYGREVKATGSVWGGDWNGNDRTDPSDTDLVHMQGISIGMQAKMRAIGYAESTSGRPEWERAALVRQHYGLPPVKLVTTKRDVPAVELAKEILAQRATGKKPDAQLVKAFQRMKGLDVDGLVGPKTLYKLNRA